MAKPAGATNNFNPDLVKNLVGKIEGHFDDIDSERGKFMKKCRDIRDSISGVYDEADARGIPKKELRKFVTARMAMGKARKILDDLEADQRETVELLAEAFGDAADLPLFASKIEKVQRAGDSEEAGHPQTH